ncbi:threonine/serine exporter family protein [Ammoniphilus resinae]|uniref:Uncharacterized membrane protein YjjP (DUF1212 family) n=1 Tax=Ammoniphilus resinae TaxID=861532 RepID=A0ABS4GU38_9BACL|nr:threonine/serine exporter family protein [Ammoniphilus resinae]MBP1933759.1 uncharacterized membrane protein YjjP (DUF1212 family) [Ammoniphilus resinae]
MATSLPNINEIMDVCLLAGKIMLENGAETYRVEDTMARIAAGYGIKHSHSFVTPTGIIFSADGSESTKFSRILERSTDLRKVTMVNSLSRLISNGELSLTEAYHQLKVLETAKLAYPIFHKVAAAAIASGCFLIMFQGQWRDFLPAFFAGGAGYFCAVYLERFVRVKFFSESLAAFIIGLMALFFVSTKIGVQMDKIIIGSVMPLVPGLLITNAVRDLMAGHLVSGLSKGAEAFLTAFAIGTGIAVVFSFL